MGQPETIAYLGVDRASGPDITAFIEYQRGQIIDAFAIPAHMLEQPPPDLKRIVVEYRRARLRVFLEERHVGARIAERVMRLNPDAEEGVQLRGLHRTCANGPSWSYRAVPKGEFLRKYGRARFEALPNAFKIKRGKRRWVTLEGVSMSRAYLGEKVFEYMPVPLTPNKFHGQNVEWTSMSWAEFARQQGFHEPA